MRGEGDDMVLWLLRLVVDRGPRIESNAVIEVEMAARRHWGGQRPYVAKSSPESRHARRSRRGHTDIA